MSTAAVVRLVRVELTLLRREPAVAISLIVVPLVLVLVLAGVFGQDPDPDFAGVAPSDHYLTGYLGVVLASLGLVVMPVHVATQRELGVLRRYRAAGVGGGAVVCRDIVLGVVLGIVSGAVVLAAGAAAYGLSAPRQPLQAAAWFSIGLACFVTIGVALGALMPSGRSASALGNLVFLPMFLLGGGGPPRAVMTPAMQTVSDALPLTHVVGGLRHSWLGVGDDPHVVWWPVLVAASVLGMAIWHARRRPV
jgi:ABC-2 type transport system permease protein